MNWQKLFRTKGIDQILDGLESLPGHAPGLKKILGVWDLTAFGVAAILGAGVFSTIGNAASTGGPAVVFLFIFTAIACAFSAFCYAEFASSIPIAGSAYTYAYASFGELFAWIIGWDLIMEYAISNIAVAISWSQYFTGLLANYGIEIPKYLTMDSLSASRAFDQIQGLLNKGLTLDHLKASGSATPILLKGYYAWTEAPNFLGFHLVCDLPALLITFLITWIVFVGIEESKLTSNLLVVFKVLIVLMVILIGGSFIQPSNWTPFAPQGFGGVLKGVSAVFFAYIGFDAISTTAEECKNPQRDLPRGMIYSLVICTVLYALVALVLTGMVPYQKLGVGDPLAFVFGPDGVNRPWISAIVNVGGVVALSTVLLVYQLGQPRIWMAMSRDGLLPPVFSAIHPKYRTPWFSTLLTGLVVAIPSLFMNLTEVTDLTSTGTLFAFMLVCGGVLKLEASNKGKKRGKFKTPYINSKYIFPLLAIGALLACIYFSPDSVQNWLHFSDPLQPELSFWEIFRQRIPILVFSGGMVVLSYLCFTRNLSLIPVMGLASCGYLMSELGLTNWMRFGVWLITGFFVYFIYGIRHSRLRSR